MKTKTFDCVEMKHRAAAKIHEHLKNLSTEEKLSYWNEKYKLMLQKKKDAQKDHGSD